MVTAGILTQIKGMIGSNGVSIPHARIMGELAIAKRKISGNNIIKWE